MTVHDVGTNTRSLRHTVPPPTWGTRNFLTGDPSRRPTGTAVGLVLPLFGLPLGGTVWWASEREERVTVSPWALGTGVSN